MAILDQQLTLKFSSKRYLPPTPPEYEDKKHAVFNSNDNFELTYDELLEIISKARLAGPQLIPIIEMIN